MVEKKWKSAITTHVEGIPHIRGYKLTEMLEKLSFTQSIFLVIKGELPTEKEENMLNALLVASIDHGIEAPSTTVARITASCGVPLSTAVASGVAAIGDAHGGAIEAAAKIFQESVEKNKGAAEIVEKARFKGERLPGFGHKIYETDPRTEVLIKVAQNNGLKGKYVDLALEIEKELEQAVGKKLCLNIDGITAAVMSEMGFDYRLGKGFFIIGRIAGFIAHVHEEITREKPVKRISEEEVEYDGPNSRKLP